MFSRCFFGFLAVVLVALPGVADEWVLNGDFEGWDGSQLTDWTLEAGADPLQSTGFDGTGSAAVFPQQPWGSRINQTGFDCGSSWTYSMDFATADPGVAADRALNLVLTFDTGNLINLRVNGDGVLQAHDGSAWIDVFSGIAFSEDYSGDGDFGDAGEVQNVYKLQIDGDFSTLYPSCEIGLSDPNGTTITQTYNLLNDISGGVPVHNTGMETVTLKSNTSTGGFVADNVSLVGDPWEPIAGPEGFINADFEDTSDPFPVPWTIVSGTPSVHAGLQGTDSALFLHKKSDGGDRITQTIDETDPQFALDWYFGTEEPVSEGDRALNVILNSQTDGGGWANLVNLRVGKSGEIQVYDGSSWNTILENAVTFSVDANADGDFEDAGDTLNVQHIEIAADCEAGEFTVSISNPGEDAYALSATSDLWAGPTPTADDGLYQFFLSASSSSCTGSSVIDEINLTVGGSEDLAGDLNGDGMVGSADLDIVRGNWGAAVTPGDLLSGDPSGDGSVGSADLDIIRGNWGATATASAVPEPGVCVLMLLAMTAMLTRRK